MTDPQVLDAKGEVLEKGHRVRPSRNEGSVCRGIVLGFRAGRSFAVRWNGDAGSYYVELHPLVSTLEPNTFQCPDLTLIPAAKENR
jgi:hypothetical protein